jgi:hypothetical protein
VAQAALRQRKNHSTTLTGEQNGIRQRRKMTLRRREIEAT